MPFESIPLQWQLLYLLVHNLIFCEICQLQNSQKTSFENWFKSHIVNSSLYILVYLSNKSVIRVQKSCKIVFKLYWLIYGAFLSFWRPKGLVAILCNCMEMVAKCFSLCSIEEINDMRVYKWWQIFHCQVNYSFKGVRESDLKTCQAVLCCGEERWDERVSHSLHSKAIDGRLPANSPNEAFAAARFPSSLSLSLSLFFFHFLSIYPSVHSVPQD